MARTRVPTAAEIDHALWVVASVIRLRRKDDPLSGYGEAYLPILERLQAEKAALAAREALLEEVVGLSAGGGR